MFMYTDYNQHLLDNVKKIHFIGCGGSGMYPLIQILAAKGYEISGSDVLDGSIIRYEREMGVKVSLGHNADNVVGADMVVYSAAISKDNVELNAAASYGIPTVERSVLLGYVSRLYKQSICVSGTHGKTTVMRAQTTGEQTVSIADMHNVIDIAVSIANTAAEAVSPVLDVVVSVARHGRNARGAARHVDFLYLGAWHGKQLVRIGITHVLFGGERSLLYIREGLDRIRIEAGLVKGLLVEVDALVTVDEGFLHALKLQILKLDPFHMGDFVLVRHTLRLPENRAFPYPKGHHIPLTPSFACRWFCCRSRRWCIGAHGNDLVLR